MMTTTENPLSGILAVVLNAVMKLEGQLHLPDEPNESTDIWSAYAIGYKRRTLQTYLGTI